MCQVLLYRITWSVTSNLNLEWSLNTFQLTRSRGAWRKKRRTVKIGGLISTHTLTWSVTDTLIENLPAIIISTHTLTWSVTSPPLFGMNITCISTHTLTWSVTRCGCYSVNNHAISTHTLTWSVTGITGYKQAEATFQLTRSRGAWLTVLFPFLFVEKFQLTRSRGAWPFSSI